MTAEVLVQRYAEAAREFDRHEQREDGSELVSALSDGLSTLKELAFRRMHFDVEELVGLDSMLMPLSPVKSERQAKTEIELFQIAESAMAAREHGFLKDNHDWFAGWLTRLRFGDDAGSKTCRRRLSDYADQSADDRRLKFGDILAAVFPESRRAPLVLFRLFPLAIHVATALAFGDHLAASELRSRQLFYLPVIEDCHDCHGRLLANIDKCPHCENPLWNYRWLTSAD